MVSNGDNPGKPTNDCVPTRAPAKPGPVTLTVYNPTGATEITYLHAPRVDTLAGKTICEISDNAWEHTRTFPLIRELLQKQFPTAKIIPYTEFPGGSNLIDNKEIVDRVKEKGCEAVVVGNAA